MIANRRVGSMPVVAVCACAAALLAPTVAQAQVFTMTREQLIEYTAQTPFERFPDGRPKVPDALMQRARGMSVEEVFGVLPGKGFRNQYEDGFQVLHPGKKMVGREFTVQFMPTRPDVETVMNAKAREKGVGVLKNQTALDMLQPGDVLVVDLFGKKEKKACTYCHGKIEGKEAMPKNLNDAGTYYKGHDHKLDGYVPKK